MTKTKKTAAKKNTARKPAAKSTKKKASPKSKKAKKGIIQYPVLTAFVAGALLSILLLLGINIVSQEKAVEQSVQRTAAKSAVLMETNTKKPKPPVKPTPPPTNTKQETAVLSPETQSAVNKALEELQNMPPYEDKYIASLSESISFIDYAMLQAILKSEIPTEHFEVTGQIARVYNDEPYKFQRISLYIPGSTKNFENKLRQSLKTWTADARLESISAREWNIYSGKVLTHSVSLLKKQSTGSTQATTPVLRHADSPALLVIVIDDLGPSTKTVNRLLQLNYPVTLAFWPHADKSAAGAKMAWEKGREALIHQPMEPIGYPRVNSGKGTITMNMDAGTIRKVTEESLKLVPYAVGLNNHMGSRLTQEKSKVSPLIAVLREKNMFVLDSLTDHRSVFFEESTKQGLRTFKRDLFLDVTPTKAHVLDQLAKAEKIALLKGKAIVIGHPHQGTLEALEEWQRKRNLNIQIVRLQDLK